MVYKQWPRSLRAEDIRGRRPNITRLEPLIGNGNRKTTLSWCRIMRPLSDSVRRSPEFPFPGQHSFNTHDNREPIARQLQNGIINVGRIHPVP